MKMKIKYFMTTLILTVSDTLLAQEGYVPPSRLDKIIDSVFVIGIYVIIIGMLIGVLSLRKIKRSYGGRPLKRKSWSGYSGSSGGVPYGDGFKAINGSSLNEDDEQE